MMKLKLMAAGLLLAAPWSSFVLAEDKVDAALPDYQTASGVSGNLSSVGSDTLANLMTLWAEEIGRAHV